MHQCDEDKQRTDIQQELALKHSQSVLGAKKRYIDCLVKRVNMAEVELVKRDRAIARKAKEAQEIEQALSDVVASYQGIIDSRAWKLVLFLRLIASIFYRCAWPIKRLFKAYFRRTLSLGSPSCRESNVTAKVDIDMRSHGTCVKSYSVKSISTEKNDGDFNKSGFEDYLIIALFSPHLEQLCSKDGVPVTEVMISYGKRLHTQYINYDQTHLVSVIMPALNRATVIGDAIQSVLNQSYHNWELIIIDDNSTDSTKLVVDTYHDNRIRYIRLNENLGSAGARNAGLDIIKGQYICYLDSDNTLAPDFILILLNQLLANEALDCVYCAQQRTSLDANNQVTGREVLFSPFQRAKLENTNFIDIGVILHKRECLDGVGQFNKAMRRLADWEFILRLTENKPALAVPCILSHYIMSQVNNQNTSVEPLRAALPYIWQYLQADPIAPLLKQSEIPELALLYSPRHSQFVVSRRPVSIIILSHESVDYLKVCVEAIYLFTKDSDFELIIVDNGSSAAVIAYLKQLSEQGLAKIILNNENKGSSSAANQGIAAASTGRDLLILNDRAVVTRGWLDAMQSVLTHHSDAGLVIPRRVVLSRDKTLLVHQPNQNPAQECDISLSAYYANVLDPQFDERRGYMTLNYASFFCVYIPRSIAQVVGALDDNIGQSDQLDRAYCHAVRRLAGRSIIYTPYSKIYHVKPRNTL